MKRMLLLSMIFFLMFAALADMPGHIYREPVNVQFKNIAAIGEYSLYITDFDSSIEIKTDTTYIISASQGSPHCIFFYAKAKDNYTDTSQLCEYDQQNTIIELRGVDKNKLIFSKISTAIAQDSSQRNEGEQIISDESFFAKNTALCISLSIAGLIGLVFLFIYYKRKKRQ
mgnify:CR=1 FL=1